MQINAYFSAYVEKLAMVSISGDYRQNHGSA
jgi:hypothetical protein